MSEGVFNRFSTEDDKCHIFKWPCHILFYILMNDLRNLCNSGKCSKNLRDCLEIFQNSSIVSEKKGLGNFSRVAKSSELIFGTSSRSLPKLSKKFLKNVLRFLKKFGKSVGKSLEYLRKIHWKF